MRPQRLYRVDDQRGPRFADALADTYKVDEGSIGPVAVRDGHDGGIGIDLLGAGYCDEPGAALLGQHAPRVDVGRELVLEDQYLLPLPHRDVRRCDGDPVAYGRDDRDATGIPAHEFREEGANLLCLLEEIVGRKLPGPRLARDGPLPDFPRPA